MQNHRTATGFAVLMLAVWLVVSLAGCDLPSAAPAVATQQLSAPTLAPTAPVPIRDSQELYGNIEVSDVINPTSAAGASGASLPPLPLGTREASGGEAVRLAVSSGQIATGEFYQTEVPQPIIVMIGSSIDMWGTVPRQIHNQGSNVLVLAMASLQPDDIDDILDSVVTLGNVDVAELVVLVDSGFAWPAIQGCSQFDCDGLVLLSPALTSDQVDSVVAFRTMTNQPVLLITSSSDDVRYPAAAQLAQQLAAPSRFITTAAGQSVGLLAQGTTLSQLFDWIDNIATSGEAVQP